MAKELEVEYLKEGRYSVRVGEDDYVNFTPKDPKHKVPEKVAQHLAKQKTKYTGEPYFKVKGIKPDLTTASEPDIEE